MNMREQIIKKELHNFTKDVVSENAKWEGERYEVTWHDIDSDDRNKIVAYMTELDGKDFLAIGENDDNFRDDILAKLLRMLTRDDMEAELDFAESVKRAVHHYYEDKAIEYVDELVTAYTHDTLADRGLRIVQDRNHGDFFVQRI